MKYQLINISGGRSKLAFFIFIVIFCYILASLLAVVIASMAGYDQIMERLNSPDLTDQVTLNLNSVVQITFQLGLFILGPFLYIFLVEQNPLQKLGLNKSPFRINYLLIIVLMVVAIPGINYMHTLNQALHLPDWLSNVEKWIQRKETSAKDMTDAFLSMKSYKYLGLNLIMFGLLPAVGEELFFRGALFAIIKEWTKRIHLTIFITAFLFSAIHLQFYGFLPRFLLGIGFGYLFVFTGSLWAPMLAHFLNNSIAVIAAFLFNQGMIATSQDDFGSVDILAINLLSIVVTLYLFRVISLRDWSN